jgi:hypothetical protein
LRTKSSKLTFEIGLHLQEFEPKHLRVDRDRVIASTGSLRFVDELVGLDGLLGNRADGVLQNVSLAPDHVSGFRAIRVLVILKRVDLEDDCQTVGGVLEASMLDPSRSPLAGRDLERDRLLGRWEDRARIGEGVILLRVMSRMMSLTPLVHREQLRSVNGRSGGPSGVEELEEFDAGVGFRCPGCLDRLWKDNQLWDYPGRAPTGLRP